MAMGISKGLSFLCLVAIFISLLFIKVADADFNHYGGIHAVGHAVDPFCPGGYSEGGHCQDINRVRSLMNAEALADDDFDDRYKVTSKVALTTPESTAEAVQEAADLDIEKPDREEEFNEGQVTILGH